MRISTEGNGCTLDGVLITRRWLLQSSWGSEQEDDAALFQRIDADLIVALWFTRDHYHKTTGCASRHIHRSTLISLIGFESTPTTSSGSRPCLATILPIEKSQTGLCCPLDGTKLPAWKQQESYVRMIFFWWMTSIEINLIRRIDGTKLPATCSRTPYTKAYLMSAKEVMIKRLHKDISLD